MNTVAGDAPDTFAGISRESIERWKTLKFSAQQKQILIWIYKEEEKDASLPEKEKAFLEDKERKGNFYINYIPWSARRLLGTEPTNNQSTALSRSLSSLEKRGIILLKDSTDEQPGKRRRTSHVAFTKAGRLIAENLKEGYVIRQPVLPSLEAAETNRWTALGYAVQLLKKEKARIQAALEADTEEGYTTLRISDGHGSVTKDRQGVRPYFLGISNALKTLEQEYEVLDDKIRGVFLFYGAKETESENN